MLDWNRLVSVAKVAADAGADSEVVNWELVEYRTV